MRKYKTTKWCLFILFRKWIATRERTIQSWTSMRERSVSWPVEWVYTQTHTLTHTHTYSKCSAQWDVFPPWTLSQRCRLSWVCSLIPAGQLSVQNNESLYPHLHSVCLCCKLNQLMRTLHKLNMLPNSPLSRILSKRSSMDKPWHLNTKKLMWNNVRMT